MPRMRSMFPVFTVKIQIGVQGFLVGVHSPVCECYGDGRGGNSGRGGGSSGCNDGGGADGGGVGEGVGG